MKAKKRRAKGVLGIVMLLLFLGTLAYLDGSGRAASWPEVQANITGSRTMPLVIHRRPPFVLWKGEYELVYEVDGKQHSIWTDAGGWDEDRIFVENRMSGPHLPRYTVRFTPPILPKRSPR